MREDDGLETDLGFTMPSSSPGVWQLSEGTSPMSPWISQLKPYLLDNFDQFRQLPWTVLTNINLHFNEAISFIVNCDTQEEIDYF